MLLVINLNSVLYRVNLNLLTISSAIWTAFHALHLLFDVYCSQNSDPRSAFATIEKGTGSLTPMLGDRKVSIFSFFATLISFIELI